MRCEVGPLTWHLGTSHLKSTRSRVQILRTVPQRAKVIMRVFEDFAGRVCHFIVRTRLSCVFSSPALVFSLHVIGRVFHFIARTRVSCVFPSVASLFCAAEMQPRASFVG